MAPLHCRELLLVCAAAEGRLGTLRVMQHPHLQGCTISFLWTHKGDFGQSQIVESPWLGTVPPQPLCLQLPGRQSLLCFQQGAPYTEIPVSEQPSLQNVLPQVSKGCAHQMHHKIDFWSTHPKPPSCLEKQEKIIPRTPTVPDLLSVFIKSLQ